MCLRNRKKFGLDILRNPFYLGIRNVIWMFNNKAKIKYCIRKKNSYVCLDIYTYIFQCNKEIIM